MFVGIATEDYTLSITVLRQIFNTMSYSELFCDAYGISLRKLCVFYLYLHIFQAFEYSCILHLSHRLQPHKT